MKFYTECLYCGSQTVSRIKLSVCPICGDKHVKHRLQPPRYNVFGYDEPEPYEELDYYEPLD